MTKLKLCVLASVLAITAGCAAQVGTGPTPTPIEESTANYRAVRAVEWAGADLAAMLAAPHAKAFILLDNNDNGRNKKICNAFQELPSGKIINAVTSAVAVPTYWLMKTANPGNVTIDGLTCKQLLAGFDYARAKQIGNAYKIPKQSRPYIIAIDSKGKAFYIDIDKASKDQIRQAMTGWYDAASQSPGEDGTAYVVWWRRLAQQMCSDSFFQTVAASLVPGFAAPVLGLAIDKAGCKAETGNDTVLA